MDEANQVGQGKGKFPGHFPYHLNRCLVPIKGSSPQVGIADGGQGKKGGGGSFGMKPSGQGFFRENQLQAAVIPAGAGRTLGGDAEMAELCIGGAGPSQKPVLDKERRADSAAEADEGIVLFQDCGVNLFRISGAGGVVENRCCIGGKGFPKKRNHAGLPLILRQRNGSGENRFFFRINHGGQHEANPEKLRTADELQHPFLQKGMAKLSIGVPGRSVKLLLQEGGTADINELGVHPFSSQPKTAI